MESVLHIANYSASYRGNFIESLERLDKELKSMGKRNIYLFCAEAKRTGAVHWIEEMRQRGCVVEFLSGKRSHDIEIIKSLIEKYDVKIVHTHFVTMQHFMNVKQAVSENIPIVMHMHNHSKKCNAIKTAIRRHIYKRCIMVGCSESVYHSLERDYPDNEKCYIDNGVNFDRLENYSCIEASEYNISEDEIVCLIFGFDFYRKGVDLALKALSALRDEGHKYTLLVSLSTNFEYVEDQIKKILGEIPSWVKIVEARNDVASLYNFSELFLSPSREEGLPYSVVEAGYCNCSIVLSDISAQAKLKIKYGYWFRDGDVDGLKNQILIASAEHAKKLEHTSQVKDYMKESYSLDRWSKEVVGLYDRVLERK